MALHAVDSTLWGWKFATEEARAIWSDRATLERWLEVEATVAVSQAALGMIPEEAARQIDAHATLEAVTLDDVAARFRKTNLDTLAMVQALADAVPDDVSGYVHWGLTTTGITETALALQLGETVELLRRDLRALEERFLDLAEEHKQTVMVARTHSQHALPYTFGLKAAIWARRVRRLLDRLDDVERAVRVGKVVGAAGTYASFGGKGPALEAEVCRRLDLEPSDITAQVSQDRFKRYANALGAMASTVRAIANEVWIRQRTEIDELREPVVTEEDTTSTTFAFKRNPLQIEWLRGTATLVERQANAMGDLNMEDERDGTRFAFYRVLLPEASVMTHAVVEQMLPVASDLEVDEAAMERNLGLTEGFITSENVMMTIARRGAGKGTAYEIIKEVAKLATEEELSFREALRREGSVYEYVDEAELEALTDPSNYLGEAVALVEQTVEDLRGDARDR